MEDESLIGPDPAEVFGMNIDQAAKRQSSLGGNLAGNQQGEHFYEELKRLHDSSPFEPYYQTDLKRFGTNISQNDKDSEPAPATNTNLINPKTERQNSRRQSSAGSKRSKYKSNQRPKNVVNAAEQFTRRRKLWRLCTLLWVIIIVAAVVGIFFAFGVRNEVLPWKDNFKDVRITLDNCRLFLTECGPNSCQTPQIMLDYRSSLNTLFRVFSNLPGMYNHTESGSTLVYNVKHLDSMRGCNLNLNYPRGFVFTALNIKCTQRCIIIQSAGGLETESFSLSGDQVSSNLRTFSAGAINVTISKGYFQVNKLQARLAGSATASRSILVGNGDIVVQTFEPLRVGFETSSENYCFSSDTANWKTAVTRAELSGQLARFITPLNRQSGLHQYYWTGAVDLCSKSGCGSQIESLKLLNFDGNIYVSVLDTGRTIPTIGSTTTKGSNYGYSVDLPLSTKLSIKTQVARTDQTTWPNLVIRFALGNVEGRSSSGQSWVYVDNPIFSIIKPWWLSFFTLGRLVENSNDISTYLSPGFCPYKPILGQQENKQISSMFGKYLNLVMGVISLQKNAQDSVNPDINSPTDGFFRPSNVAFFSDEWIKIRVLNGQDDTYEIVALTEITAVFLIMVLSVLFAVYLAIRFCHELRTLIFKSFQQIREKHYHIEMYWKVFSKVANANRKEAIQLVLEDEVDYDTDRLGSAFTKTVDFKPVSKWREVPSTTAFVDYLLAELTQSKSSSLRRFYDIAFQEVEVSAFGLPESQNAAKDSTPLKLLKSLYQQMCFMQGFQEAELTSPESVRMLKGLSMMLHTSRDSRKPYLIRLTISPVSDFNMATLKADKKNTSLQVFVQKFCEITNFDEDKLAMETFMDKYNTFCKLNHLPVELVDQAILKSKFGIESRFEVQETVERDFSNTTAPSVAERTGFLKKAGQLIEYVTGSQKYYTLNLEKARNVNLFLAGKLNESDVGKVRFRAIAESVILVRYWWLHDIGAVLMEIFIYCVVSFPFLAIFIFQEIEHSAYSLRPEEINIYGFNFQTDEIWLIPRKVVIFNPDLPKRAADSRNSLLCVLLDQRPHQHGHQHLAPGVPLDTNLRSEPIRVFVASHPERISVVSYDHIGSSSCSRCPRSCPTYVSCSSGTSSQGSSSQAPT